jgi:cystathionine beta-lyase
MPFDFDTPIERAGTDSNKWTRYGEDVLPLWVADMDFAAPPPVIAALQQRIAHGVFGYNHPTEAQADAVVGYLERHFDWAIEPDWIVWLPGLVSGLNIVCRAVGEPGDGVFTATPIYPPFLSAPINMQRRRITAPLSCDGKQWRWDFAATEAALKGSRSKLFLLCHPHNPTGRAWTEDELMQIVNLCERNELVICSDEIHNGLILDPSRKHRVLAALAPEIAERTITLMAASKSYNIPGLGCAFAIVPNGVLRRNLLSAMNGIVPHVNLLGLTATAAALAECDDWHAALIDILRVNARAVEQAVAALPGLHMCPVEATYLAWIDARELCRGKEIAHPARYFEQHGLGLSEGADFGLPGFVRLNFGTQRVRLDEALRRLASAVAA